MGIGVSVFIDVAVAVGVAVGGLVAIGVRSGVADGEEVMPTVGTGDDEGVFDAVDEGPNVNPGMIVRDGVAVWF